MKRIPQLDGLRGLAVLMVFFHHALRVPLFWSGVDLFFVLSGYLITGILLRLKEEKATHGYGKTFYLRRIRRIVPPYLGFMVFLLLFIPVPWRQVWYWYAFFGANFANALDRVNVSAMAPLWSLAVEEQFYFIWPWVVLWCSRKRLRQLALGIVIAEPILRALCTPLFPNSVFIYSLMPFRADLLACGAFVATCEQQDSEWIQRNRGWSRWSFLIALFLLMGLSALPSFRHTANSMLFNTVGYSLVVVVFAGALIQALAMRAGLAYRFLTALPLRYMGRISYTFYLYQVPFLEMVSHHVRSRAAVTILGFAATFLFSTLSWHFFEAPILDWGRTEGRKPDDLAAVGPGCNSTTK
jgi:peptidoglycan/LPS O-acetylase OafA/YrhL